MSISHEKLENGSLGSPCGVKPKIGNDLGNSEMVPQGNHSPGDLVGIFTSGIREVSEAWAVGFRPEDPPGLEDLERSVTRAIDGGDEVEVRRLTARYVDAWAEAALRESGPVRVFSEALDREIVLVGDRNAKALEAIRKRFPDLSLWFPAEIRKVAELVDEGDSALLGSIESTKRHFYGWLDCNSRNGGTRL